MSSDQTTLPTAYPSPRPTAERPAALALAAGVLVGLTTMALHPTGRDVVREAAAGAANTRVTAVHVAAVLAEAALLAGTLGLTRRLRARPDGVAGPGGAWAGDVAVGASVCFALATVAALVAAAASGFLAPGVVRGLAAAGEAERAVMLRALALTGLVNRTFARLYVLLSGAAVLLWSGAMLARRAATRRAAVGLGPHAPAPPRVLAVYGLLLGAALVAGAAAGHLRLDVHGFGLLVLGQAVWLGGAAAHLWRAPGR